MLEVLKQISLRVLNTDEEGTYLMKVTCQLCGTRYEYEINRGRCPECAALYQNTDNTGFSEEEFDHSQLHKSYDENSVHTMYSSNQECGASFEEKPVSEKKRRTKIRNNVSPVKRVIVALEIVATVFFVVLPFIGMYNSKKKLEELRITEKPTVVPKMIDESVVVGSYTIQVKDYYIDKSSYWNLPDNYVVYAVSYKTTHQGNTYTSLYSGVQVYLETSDGMTISPLGSYDAKEFMTGDRYETMERNIADYIKSDGGILYFVLKENEDIYGLRFDVYECDEEDYNYKKMDTTYVMYLPEVEVE